MDRNLLRQTLLEQLQEDMGQTYEDLDESLSLREGLGLDSIDVVTVVIHIQSRLGIELKSEELQNIVNVGGLLDLIQVKLAAVHHAA